MAAWQPTTSYAVGDKVERSEPGLYEFIATNSGTSGETEPEWREGMDMLTVDGGVIWIAALRSLAEGSQIIIGYRDRQRGPGTGIRRMGVRL